MNRTITPCRVRGTVSVPSSKSQTIRALLIATFSTGTSYIENPLVSADTRSCVEACRAMGAVITSEQGIWRVEGIDSEETGPLVIDTGNSGTTLYLGAGMAAALARKVYFTGDEQIRNRPVGALLESLKDLGAKISYDVPEELHLGRAGKEGCPPFMIEGPLTGGCTEIACPTSQYLSSLLLASPLAAGAVKITVPLLNERPYVEMTKAWLDEQGIEYTAEEGDIFHIPGNQSYHRYRRMISGDFSSASFFFCAAAVTGSTLKVYGLDRHDTQGDKDILSCLEQLGCTVTWEDQSVTVKGPESGLNGDVSFDLNPIPDTLPVLAAVSCFAKGTVRLENVPQARIKETDRIAVMHQELSGLGADIEELPDGLIVHGQGRLSGGTVSGHGDHRVIMAMSIAALASDAAITIEGTDAVDITCPEFFSLLESILEED